MVQFAFVEESTLLADTFLLLIVILKIYHLPASSTGQIAKSPDATGFRLVNQLLVPCTMAMN